MCLPTPEINNIRANGVLNKNTYANALSLGTNSCKTSNVDTLNGAQQKKSSVTLAVVG